jgi:hypothetical protein
MATSFSGGRSRGEPPTMGKQLVNFITCGCEIYIQITDMSDTSITVIYNAILTTSTGTVQMYIHTKKSFLCYIRTFCLL